jgi:hypothetical protein
MDGRRGRPAHTAQRVTIWGHLVNRAPLVYRDPSGHSPVWFDQTLGAIAQYIDDVSLGSYSALTGDLGRINNAAFQEGREIGRVVSEIQGYFEIVQGATAVIAIAAAGPPTAAAAAVCTAGTGGACVIPGGAVLASEGLAAAGGAVEVAHGGLMLAKIANDPLGHVSKGNVKTVGAKQLKTLEVDPHEVKRAILGDKADIKRWDIVQDTDSGLYYLMNKSDKSTPLLEIGDLDELKYLSEP